MTASCAGGRRSIRGARRACRTSPSLGTAAASPEPRRRFVGAPRRTRRSDRLGHIDEPERDGRAAPFRAALVRERALRAFLDRLYRPAPSVLVPREDEIIVVPLRGGVGRPDSRAPRVSARGPNQIKAFTRCGMGPCQGRICGPIVSAVIADALGQTDRRNRHLAAPRPVQADHRRRPRRSRHGRERTRVLPALSLPVINERGRRTIVQPRARA